MNSLWYGELSSGILTPGTHIIFHMKRYASIIVKQKQGWTFWWKRVKAHWQIQTSKSRHWLLLAASRDNNLSLRPRYILRSAVIHGVFAHFSRLIVFTCSRFPRLTCSRSGEPGGRIDCRQNLQAKKGKKNHSLECTFFSFSSGLELTFIFFVCHVLSRSNPPHAPFIGGIREISSCTATLPHWSCNMLPIAKQLTWTGQIFISVWMKELYFSVKNLHVFFSANVSLGFPWISFLIRASAFWGHADLGPQIDQWLSCGHEQDQRRYTCSGWYHCFCLEHQKTGHQATLHHICLQRDFCEELHQLGKASVFKIEDLTKLGQADW